jgi:hypothetical protein
MAEDKNEILRLIKEAGFSFTSEDIKEVKKNYRKRTCSIYQEEILTG